MVGVADVLEGEGAGDLLDDVGETGCWEAFGEAGFWAALEEAAAGEEAAEPAGWGDGLVHAGDVACGAWVTGTLEVEAEREGSAALLLVVSLGLTVTVELVPWVSVDPAGGELVDAVGAVVAADAAFCEVWVPAVVVNDAHVVVGVGVGWLLLLLAVPACTGTPAAEDWAAEAWPSGTPPPPPAAL